LSGTTTNQVGLDVSLVNLRNARKSTGAYVVLGDAANMPFRDGIFSLVSGSAFLHHVQNWEKAIVESCRVCSKNGGILFDSEPTSESLSLSCLAKFVFEMRLPVYKFISYFDSRKVHFRNIAIAREYYQTAEVHNQPGRGFSIKEIAAVFSTAGFTTEVFLSPNEHLKKREIIPWNEAGWKRIVLHLLSGNNPRLSKYGTFTLLAVYRKDNVNRCSHQ
jgi:ubiquinone/menaquinone biosynthesis C-methylase UbiE